MQVRLFSLKILSVAFVAGSLLSAVGATPAAALPSYCRQQAWWFCDPYFARGTADWTACVEEFISTCVDPGCISYDGGATCVANKSPKAKMLKPLHKLIGKA